MKRYYCGTCTAITTNDPFTERDKRSSVVLRTDKDIIIQNNIHRNFCTSIFIDILTNFEWVKIPKMNFVAAYDSKTATEKFHKAHEFFGELLGATLQLQYTMYLTLNKAFTPKNSRALNATPPNIRIHTAITGKIPPSKTSIIGQWVFTISRQSIIIMCLCVVPIN